MSLRSLADSTVLAGLATLIRQTQQITAALIAHILEIEHRQLYRDMGYDSMRAFLIQGHRFGEEAAERRLQAAHAVRRWPQLLERISDGRLHLTAVCLLSPHLDENNANELIEAATHGTRSQIEAMLVARRAAASSGHAPQPEMNLSGVPSKEELQQTQSSEAASPDEPSLERVDARESSQVGPPAAEPLTRISIRESTRAKLRHAHDLVAGAVPYGDHDRVIAQALDEFIAKRMKRKFAMPSKPRPNRTTGEDGRSIPAGTRRAVFARDGGRCTFVGPTGHRCESRAVQYDHIVPRARGGTSTIPNLRLRCGPHNQLEAERTFGREFMKRKRAEAVDPDRRDLLSGLRNLGYRAAEAREATGIAMQATTGSLEERMRAALAWLAPGRES